MSMRKSLGGLIALLVALAACSTQVRQEESIPTPESVQVEGVRNAHRVGADLLFAGQLTPEGIAELAKQGYHTVLNMRGEDEMDWDEKAAVEAAGMSYETLPMAYPIESIPDEWVDRFDALMRDASRPIVLHCSSGNRVAGLWAVWLAEREGVDPARALELGREAGMTRLAPVVEKRLGVESAEAPGS